LERGIFSLQLHLFFPPKFLARGWAIKNSLTIGAIEHILDFWKENFIVNILCFISLVMLCLKVEVIKMLIWTLNEPAVPFKIGKK